MMVRLSQTADEKRLRVQNLGPALDRAARLTDLSGEPVEFKFGDWDVTLWPGKIKLPHL